MSLRRMRPRARRRMGRDVPRLCLPLLSPGHPAARGPSRPPPPTWPGRRAPPPLARAVAGPARRRPGGKEAATVLELEPVLCSAGELEARCAGGRREGGAPARECLGGEA